MYTKLGIRDPVSSWTRVPFGAFVAVIAAAAGIVAAGLPGISGPTVMLRLRPVRAHTGRSKARPHPGDY